MSWNKGLSKDTDARVARSALNMRKYYAENGHHNAGKTKENDEGVRQKAVKIKAALREHYASNDGWSLGLTKETSDIIALRAKKISKALLGKSLSPEHIESLKRAKTLQIDEVNGRFRSLGFTLIDAYEHSMRHVTLTCLKCGKNCKKTLHATIHGSKCPTCFPPWAEKTSKWQREVHEYVASLVHDTVIDDR